jgi:hypothetical protein
MMLRPALVLMDVQAAKGSHLDGGKDVVVITTLLFNYNSCCLPVCYKSYNRYLKHFYLSNRAENLHTCVKSETMHELIDKIKK